MKYVIIMSLEFELRISFTVVKNQYSSYHYIHLVYPHSSSCLSLPSIQSPSYQIFVELRLIEPSDLNRPVRRPSLGGYRIYKIYLDDSQL